VAWRHPGVFGNLLLQSGSFVFTDIGEQPHGPTFEPVARFVRRFREEPGRPAERVALTCGVYENMIDYVERTPHLDVTLRRYARLFDLGAIGAQLGYPLYLKPCSGGGWVAVTRVENEAELHDAYAATPVSRTSASRPRRSSAFARRTSETSRRSRRSTSRSRGSRTRSGKASPASTRRTSTTSTRTPSGSCSSAAARR